MSIYENSVFHFAIQQTSGCRPHYLKSFGCCFVILIQIYISNSFPVQNLHGRSMHFAESDSVRFRTGQINCNDMTSASTRLFLGIWTVTCLCVFSTIHHVLQPHASQRPVLQCTHAAPLPAPLWLPIFVLRSLLFTRPFVEPPSPTPHTILTAVPVCFCVKPPPPSATNYITAC